ncbi:MAG: outer membrane beta-barrel protein [Bacteroidaceae bacterium]|nr:outer membrane beta-barrel protein [Bacteroidaceae bacterium]
MLRKTLVTTLISLALVPTYAQQINSDAEKVFAVEGTELSKLRSIADVLGQIPGVLCDEEQVLLEGRGTAQVYIDNRLLTETNELWHTPANLVETISVIREPGAQYGKDVRAVVVIHLDHVIVERGLHVDEYFHLDLSNGLAPNNELALRWNSRKVYLNGFASWNETKTVSNKKDYETVYTPDFQLKSANLEEHRSHFFRKNLTAKVTSLFRLSEDHTLSASYMLERKPHQFEYNTNFKCSEFEPIGGKIDYSHPSDVDYSKRVTEDQQLTRHTMDLEYTGKMGAWSINAGANAFWEDQLKNNYTNNELSQYDRGERLWRTYLKITRELGTGALTLGGEGDFNRMNVLHGKSPEDEHYVHTQNTDNTYAVFGLLTQKAGAWDFSAGLRYEKFAYTYKPYDDDYMLGYLKSKLTPEDVRKIPNWQEYIFPYFITNGQLTSQKGGFYPSLSASVNLGDSKLTLLHTENYNKPYLGKLRIELGDIWEIDQRVLRVETIYSTSLAWSWKWLDAQATHHYFDHPVCTTTDDDIDYTGLSYHAFDISINATPRIGVWQPALMVLLHKQWDKQVTVSGYKLRTPFAAVTWNNTIDLNGGWFLRVNTHWNSKGSERNIHYYSSIFTMDAAIQKSMMNNRLIVELSGENILHTNRSDVTKYEQPFKGASKGFKNQEPSTLRLSVRYKI